MATFRYRKLTSSRDAEAVALVKAEYQANALTLRSRLDASRRAEHDAPVAVHADEAEAPEHELRRQLAEGELTPNDLVFSNGAWTTFSSSAEFYEACCAQEDDEREANELFSARKLLFLALFLAPVIWLLWKG